VVHFGFRVFIHFGNTTLNDMTYGWKTEQKRLLAVEMVSAYLRCNSDTC